MYPGHRTFRLCRFSLLTAALVVSVARAQAASNAPGIELAQTILRAESSDQADTERHLDHLRVFADKLSATGTVVGDDTQRAEAIHRFMHAEALGGGYVADAHTLAELLETGRFNCLSGTLLFFTLAATYDLPLVAIESRGHITAGLRGGDAISPIETTTADWQPQWMRAESIAIGAARIISRQQLLAAVYYNRGWQCLQNADYAAAIAANRQALALDPLCQAARNNLLASLNNWAVALSAAGQYAQALEALQTGQSIDASFAPFAATRQHVLWHARQAEAKATRGVANNGAK